MGAGAPRALPAAAVAGLRQAFAQELVERLPRLAAGALTSELLRDLHALGSSAYIVGQDEAARTARAAESLLARARDGEPGLEGQVRLQTGRLVVLLRAWAP